MRIYIAGKMTGIRDHNFPLFNHAADQLRQEGHEVFNPADLTRDRFGTVEKFMALPLNEQMEAVRWLLAKELSWICLHADAVCLLPGWETSKGANAEKAAAEATGVKIMYFDLDADLTL